MINQVPHGGHKILVVDTIFYLSLLGALVASNYL